MITNFTKLKEEVVETNLCVRCGTCEGVCPENAVKIKDILGICEPVQVANCVDCGLCFNTCPGKSLDFKDFIKTNNFDSYDTLGVYKKIFVGSSKNEKIRQAGASGGMATEISLQLLEEQLVDGIVVLDFETDKPYFPKVKIVSDRKSLSKAAQSKYFIFPQNVILKEIQKSAFKKIAFVGLPCQVHGIRKAIQNKIIGTEKIKYILGIYCGNNLYYDATMSLLRRFGFHNLDTIQKLAYREGDYPGNFVVSDINGKKGKVDKITFNYLSFFYTPHRCLTCIDLSNELADISFGDGWHGIYAEKNQKGRSIVIVRTTKLVSLVDNGIKNSRYELTEISNSLAKKMHANVLDNKKSGAPARINILRKLKKDTPQYFLSFTKISIKRYVFEVINLSVLSILSGKVFKNLSEKIPLLVYRILIKHVRGIWRKKAAKQYSNEKQKLIL